MKVAFIGLGQMGLGMARQIVSAGHETTVFDVRAEAMAAVPGAQSSSSAADAATDAEIICISVFDESQVLQVTTGSEGALASAKPGSVVMLHSTVRPGLIAEIGRAAASSGVEVIDAAMSGGGESAANAGTLTFMVGGGQEAVAKATPVLEAMSAKIFHVGVLGAGSSAKIISNFLLDGNVTLVREALMIAASAGISESEMLELVNANAVGSSWVSNNWSKMRELEQNHWKGPEVIVAMWRKDLGLANELAKANDVATPVLDFIASEVVPTMTDDGLTAYENAVRFSALIP